MLAQMASRSGRVPAPSAPTRVVAGIGRPQLTAVFKCAEAIEGSDIPVCADGGISYSGDMAKAFGAGAHNVMLGRLLAGTEESPGEIETIGGRPCKVFRGMGSLGAMQDNEASRLRYGQQESEKDKIVPEGIEGTVPYQGSVTVLLHQYVEGIKRNMGYVGAPDIETLRRIADFDYMSSAGLKESHPHDVDNIRAAPNYNPQGKGN
jgi:IMP dehydrogenase